MTKPMRSRIYVSADFEKILKAKAALRGEKLPAYTQKLACSPEIFLEDTLMLTKKRPGKKKSLDKRNFEGFL